MPGKAGVAHPFPEALRRKLFEIRKIAGERNPADVLTKALPLEVFRRHRAALMDVQEA